MDYKNYFKRTKNTQNVIILEGQEFHQDMGRKGREEKQAILKLLYGYELEQ